MLPDSLNRCLLSLSVVGELAVYLMLLDNHWLDERAILWLLLHVLCCVAGTFAVMRLWRRADLSEDQIRTTDCWVFSVSMFIPLIGLIGCAAALLYATHQWQSRPDDVTDWQITPVPDLPFTTPSGRLPAPLDNRGFNEHLMYSTDDEDLYRKVLAVGNIRASLAVSTLKLAMRHPTERIRLTAYKTLDKKVTDLNLEIQHLEQAVSNGQTEDKAYSWLRIASNYWELLTLEQGEAVAKKQLLVKASVAAINAVAVMPLNRNAHYILGRISLMQADPRRARIALERSLVLGMPGDKIYPYLAESAYLVSDYNGVREYLSKLDSAVKAYPPLSHVVGFWA